MTVGVWRYQLCVLWVEKTPILQTATKDAAAAQAARFGSTRIIDVTAVPDHYCARPMNFFVDSRVPRRHAAVFADPASISPFWPLLARANDEIMAMLN
jgi:hypothetical protein